MVHHTTIVVPAVARGTCEGHIDATRIVAIWLGAVMRIALTGATGFLGRYLVSELAAAGHELTCWYRPSSDRHHFPTPVPENSLRWVEGSLGNEQSFRTLVELSDAVVHAALDHPGGGFRGGEGDLLSFVENNLVGTIRLIEAARAANVGRFIFISSCAVHERILSDRPLDETHPSWPSSHYGAHKAAIEAFVHSYGFGQGYPICALRPSGIYGLAHPPTASKWFPLVRHVCKGESVECRRGGKEVHAADVARAVQILLSADADAITGQAFNCYDRYISEHEVATVARRLCGSDATILGQPGTPRNQIVTTKLAALGMTYGGEPLLERTIRQMLRVLES